MQNSIYKIKYLLFLSWDWEAWCLTQSWGGGGIPPSPERNTAWNKRRKCFHCLGAPNNLIRPCLIYNFLQNITPWQNPLHYKYRVRICEMQPKPGLVRSYSRELYFARIRFHCNHSHAWEPVCMFARTTLSLKARLHGSPRLINAVGSTKVNRVNSSFQRKWSTGLAGEQVGDGQLLFNVVDSRWVTHHRLNA